MKKLIIAIALLGAGAQAETLGTHAKIRVDNVSEKIASVEVLACALAYNTGVPNCVYQLRVEFRDGQKKLIRVRPGTGPLIEGGVYDLFRGDTKIIRQVNDQPCRMLDPKYPKLLSVVQTTYNSQTYRVESQDMTPIWSDDSCSLESRVRPEQDTYDRDAYHLMNIVRLVTLEYLAQ